MLTYLSIPNNPCQQNVVIRLTYVAAVEGKNQDITLTTTYNFLEHNGRNYWMFGENSRGLIWYLGILSSGRISSDCRGN